jgi:hypothetical protein
MSSILIFTSVRTNIRGVPNQLNILPPCELEERGSKAVMIIKVFLMSPSRVKRTGENLNKLVYIPKWMRSSCICIHNTIGYIALPTELSRGSE